MKHVFIINPTAGKKDCTARVMEMAKTLAARRQLLLDHGITSFWPGLIRLGLLPITALLAS